MKKTTTSPHPHPVLETLEGHPGSMIHPHTPLDNLLPLIHPTAIVGRFVSLGNNVSIGAYSVIQGHVTIGDGTTIHTHVSIGAPAQNIGTVESYGAISIGKQCVIREFVSIHASKKEGGHTLIGDNCYIMAYAHVAHDVVLENNVTLINNVALAGHTHVEQGALIMAFAASHQFCRIGSFVAVTPYSGCRQDLPPFCLFDGRPGAFAGLNAIGLKRRGFDSESLYALKKVTSLFYHKKLPLEVIREQALLEPTWGNNKYVQQFLAFIKDSKRGVSRKTIAELVE